MAKKTDKKTIHFNDMLKLMDKARIDGACVSLKAWTAGKKKGETEDVTYDSWQVLGAHWRGGFHRLRQPISGEVRTVTDIFIHEFMGKRVYL